MNLQKEVYTPKGTPTMIKGMAVLALVVAALAWLKPWKKELPTSDVTQSVGNNNTGQVGQIANSPGATVNYGNGITVEQMRALLKEKFETPDRDEKLARDFPKGYALCGVANGHLVYEPRDHHTTMNADWDSAKYIDNPTSRFIELRFPHLQILRDGDSLLDMSDISLPFQRDENISQSPQLSQAIRFGTRSEPLGVGLEVLNSTNKVFAIGLLDYPTPSH
jgi:hypothetical protein